MSTPKIQLIGVKKRFGAKVVLDGVDLETDRASPSVMIIGGSGTGKSVTIKSILGILYAGRGHQSWSTSTARTSPVIRGAARDKVMRKFGMLFQGAALFDSLPVWENVAFGLIRRQGHGARQKARDIAIQKLRQGRPVGDVAFLSLGWVRTAGQGVQKRVGLARAIAADPEIIFFDEPTTGLDPDHGRHHQRPTDFHCEGCGRYGAFSITDDMVSSARKISTASPCRYGGKIIWQGSTGDDRANPQRICSSSSSTGAPKARSKWLKA